MHRCLNTIAGSRYTLLRMRLEPIAPQSHYIAGDTARFQTDWQSHLCQRQSSYAHHRLLRRDLLLDRDAGVFRDNGQLAAAVRVVSTKRIFAITNRPTK